MQGIEYLPLHKSVLFAAARGPRLYELLALVDALRMDEYPDPGGAREELRARLRGPRSKSMSRRPSAVAQESSKRGVHGKETRIHGRRY